MIKTKKAECGAKKTSKNTTKNTKVDSIHTSQLSRSHASTKQQLLFLDCYRKHGTIFKSLNYSNITWDEFLKWFEDVAFVDKLAQVRNEFLEIFTLQLYRRMIDGDMEAAHLLLSSYDNKGLIYDVFHGNMVVNKPSRKKQ